MTDVARTAPDQVPAAPRLSLRGALSAAEIDVRLFGLLMALVALLVGFQVLTGGDFLRPSNMTTLAVP